MWRRATGRRRLSDLPLRAAFATSEKTVYVLSHAPEVRRACKEEVRAAAPSSPSHHARKIPHGRSLILSSSCFMPASIDVAVRAK